MFFHYGIFKSVVKNIVKTVVKITGTTWYQVFLGSVTVTNRHENQVKKTGFLYFPKLCKEYHWHCSESSKLSPKQQTAQFHTDGHKNICPELLYFTGTAIVLTKIYLTLLGSREFACKTYLLQWNCYSNKWKYFWLFLDRAD